MVDVFYFSEFDREVICYTVANGVARFLRDRYNLSLGIIGKYRIESAFSQGVLDFWICIRNIERRNVKQIVIIFEANDISLCAGQLLVKLAAVYELYRVKAYGFITNLIHCQMYTYECVDGKSIVEKYAIITFSNTDKPDKNTFYLLTNILMNVLEKIVAREEAKK